MAGSGAQQAATSTRQLCSVCREPAFAGASLACDRCHSPYHRDCWEFTGICSRFGCGGRQVVDPASIPREAPAAPLRMDVAPAVPAEYRWNRALGILGHRLWMLPRTLGAGLAGSVAAVLFIAATRWVGADAPILLAVLGMGLVHGLIAPFLAPLQIRWPARCTLVAAAGAVVSVWAWFAGFKYGMPGPASMLALLVMGVTSILTGACLAELLLGRRRWLGAALGPLATPARYLFTGLVAQWSLLLAAIPWRGLPPYRAIEETAFLFVIGMLAAGHPLEKAKDLLLAAENERPPRLPSRRG